MVARRPRPSSRWFGTKPNAARRYEKRIAKRDSVKSPAKKSVPARFTSVSQKPSPDVLVVNLGTLFAFCPLTTRAKEWIDENVQDDLNGSEIRLLWKPGTRGDWQRA
jgi:hypothetical protein